MMKESQLRPDESRSEKTANLLLMVALVAITATYFASRSTVDKRMPEKIVDSAEVELYLTPGGVYTATDIAENGNVTASEKFKGFTAQHDFAPKIGDAICPITRTKANPDCWWIIGGNKYTFCCPPCIDEFLTKAKASSVAIEEPGFYVQGPQ